MGLRQEGDNIIDESFGPPDPNGETTIRCILPASAGSSEKRVSIVIPKSSWDKAAEKLRGLGTGGVLHKREKKHH